MHTHNYIPYKLEKIPNMFSDWGTLYSRCKCGVMLVSPIKTEQELNEYLALKF